MEPGNPRKHVPLAVRIRRELVGTVLAVEPDHDVASTTARMAGTFPGDEATAQGRSHFAHSTRGIPGYPQPAPCGTHGAALALEALPEPSFYSASSGTTAAPLRCGIMSEESEEEEEEEEEEEIERRWPCEACAEESPGPRPYLLTPTCLPIYRTAAYKWPHLTGPFYTNMRAVRFALPLELGTLGTELGTLWKILIMFSSRSRALAAAATTLLERRLALIQATVSRA